MAILRPGVRYLSVAIGAVALTSCMALTSCEPVNQQPKTSPTSSPTARPTTSPTARPTTAAQSSTSSSTATASAVDHPRKPSIDTLRAALVVYFRDQQGLSAEKAQRAATCAVYPSFQELSARSLAAIVHHDPAGIDPGQKKVFGDVTTECVTAAG